MGSKSSTTKTSWAEDQYNLQMAQLAELQTKMSSEYFKFWQDYYKPLEISQIQANKELLPLQVGLEKSEIGLREAEIGTEKMGLDVTQLELGKRKELIPKFYEEAMTGIDIAKRKAQAQAGVQHAFGNVTGQLGRYASRYGISPSSGGFADVARTTSIEMAKGIAGATTAAETQAEKEKWERLATAYGIKG